MKRLLLLFTFFSFVTAYAQPDCSKNRSVFRFDNVSVPVVIHKLGKSPEFPFLRNIHSKKQFVAALKNGKGKGMNELNALLMDIGFANGVKDVSEASVSAENLPSGTTGKMGDSRYHYSYVKLVNPRGFKVWKISSGSGCYIYICEDCGNAFYPRDNNKSMACHDISINLSGDSKEITTEDAPKRRITKKVYIYYHQKKHKDGKPWHTSPNIPDEDPSHPLLLSKKTIMETVPQAYRVTVTTPDGRMKICDDKNVTLSTNINVENESAGDSRRPVVKREYVEVTKREYKKALRKMYKLKRKSSKITYITDVPVHI